MKKITYDGYVAFEWGPDEQDQRRSFEQAITDTASVDAMARAVLSAIQTAQARRQEAWADVAAKIEKDTGYDLGRQLLDYSNFKRLFVVLPNPNEKKIIKPALASDVPPMAPKLH